ncbi:hypothetical protein [Iningainema tapete]|uniref:Effector-associated domain-containing protein n=1 Tax=Iningainema tapete BLCC-T55 TaxID=2748662 RepID=A0A8J6XEI3_9CYAN|nr:hypothetical protein [Iningainema tapete BLCC-T55]
MTDTNNLRAILKRLVAKTYTNADLEILCQAIEAGQIILVTGERAIAVGGDVTDAVFITGDGNLVYIFKGADAEVVRQIVQDILKSFELPALLTHSEFFKSAVSAAERIAGYWEVIVGRDALLAEIKSLLVESTDVIVLHGAGGLGKTRLLLELPKVIPSGTSLWYIRQRAESIEYDLASLNPNNHHVIVVDDAHRFELLHQLGEVLVNPKIAGKVTLVLATRRVFKDSVTYKLGSLAGYQVNKIEVKPLENLDIDQLLQTPPYEIAHEDTRHTLVRIAKGDPLIAGVAARLVQRGESVINLNRDWVLTRYLNDIIHELAEAGYDDRYISYLEIMAALNTIDLNNQQLREKVQKVVGISPYDEDRIISRLVEAGIVERYWMTLKITSEVLADHILIHHFFQIKQADYQKKIIEPFFKLKPQQILTTLAEAEVKGERHAGLLLGHKLRELHYILNQGDNLARLSVLEWIQDLAYLRPDDALVIVDNILNVLEELPASNQQDHPSCKWDIKYERLLSKIVDVLSRTHWVRLSDSIDYLHKLARYQLDAAEYARVREEASKALVEIAEIKIDKSDTAQPTILNKIEGWLKEDFTSNLNLSLSLIKPMLSMEVNSTKIDPTRYLHILIRQGLLLPSESLRKIREQALGILYQAYSQTSNLSERLKIVKSLEGAILLPRSTSASEVSAETWAWLKPDCKNTAQFFLKVVIPNAELPILDAVAEWLWYAPRFSGYQLDEFEQLKQQLQNNNLYQLYKFLVSNRLRGDAQDDQLNWQAIEQRHQLAIKQYIEGLSPTAIEKAISELETIVEQCQTAGESSTYWFDTLFYRLGEKNPEFAQQMVEQALSKNLTIKHHLGPVIGGLYQSNLEVAWSYIKSWVDGDELVLWLAVAGSYHFLDSSRFQEEEWEILHRLTTKQSSLVDYKILQLISRFVPYNPQLSVKLLKIIATSDDESVLLGVADALSWSFKSFQAEWGIKFITSQDFLDILRNFERLSHLNYAAEECLELLGKIEPMQLIDFIERCIKIKAEQREIGEDYETIHFPYSRAVESIRSSTEYPDILRRVRDWMLREDFWFFETPKVLKEIAGSLSESLYNILMEWVRLGEVQKLNAVVKILCKFNSGQLFYHLSREIICNTNYEIVLGSIRASINSTPGMIFGGFSNFIKQRLEEISPWLKDENLRVRSFARQMEELLQQNLESELESEEFEERNW